MKRRLDKGFSLIEVMVAAGMLATVTVTVCTLGARSLASMQVSQEYEKAWDILDRQMKLLEQVGVNSLASSPNLSGTIEDAQSQMQYRWQLDIESMEVEELYALTLTVEWVSEGRIRKIQCDTRLRAGQDISETDTATTTTTTTTTGTSGGTAASMGSSQ